MKKRLAAAVLFAATAALSCGGPSGITWNDDIPAAMAASARDGRPVLLYFTYDT